MELDECGPAVQFDASECGILMAVTGMLDMSEHATTDQLLRSDFEILVTSVLSKMCGTQKLKPGRKMQLVDLELVTSVSV